MSDELEKDDDREEQEEHARVFRLLNQRIEGGKCETPEEVVRWMGALQAQDYQQSLLAGNHRYTTDEEGQSTATGDS